MREWFSFKDNHLFRDCFELTEDENQIFSEMTKRHVLEGTSKWSAKVAIKGSILRREPVTFRV